MILSQAEVDVQESQKRVEQFRADRDAALATPGQERRTADLNEMLTLEERLLEQLRILAKSRKPLSVYAGSELNETA